MVRQHLHLVTMQNNSGTSRKRNQLNSELTTGILETFLMVKRFRIIIASLSLKNAWLPPIFFLDFHSPC